MLGDEKLEERTGNTGTLTFLCPELVQLDNRGLLKDKHSTKTDMWSLGMILYYVCYASVPYSQISNFSDLKKEIISLKKSNIVLLFSASILTNPLYLS